jgi:hypothetical protein
LPNFSDRFLHVSVAELAGFVFNKQDIWLLYWDSALILVGRIRIGNSVPDPRRAKMIKQNRKK